MQLTPVIKHNHKMGGTLSHPSNAKYYVFCIRVIYSEREYVFVCPCSCGCANIYPHKHIP